MQEAIIYCRTASLSQNSSENNSLDIQEQKCREFASLQGYKIAQVFSDDCVSGNKINRPGMNAMLSYLNDNNTAQVVLISDYSRIGRSIEARMHLDDTICRAGGELNCPN